MTNVVEMEKRFGSHLARVGEKALSKELERIRVLEFGGKISRYTAVQMIRTMHVRLAWKANAA